MAGQSHGWRGRGKARVARLDDRLVVRYQGLSTRGARLQARFAELFRKDYRRQRPSFRPYAVTIWIEASAGRDRFDIDNVAKACLDALTGVIWHDDSQVQKLLLERLPAERNAITVVVEEASDPAPKCLMALLQAIDELESATGSDAG